MIRYRCFLLQMLLTCCGWLGQKPQPIQPDRRYDCSVSDSHTDQQDRGVRHARLGRQAARLIDGPFVTPASHCRGHCQRNDVRAAMYIQIWSAICSVQRILCMFRGCGGCVAHCFQCDAEELTHLRQIGLWRGESWDESILF